MEVPDWAHANLSRDLPLIRSRGEGQPGHFTPRNLDEPLSRIPKLLIHYYDQADERGKDTILTLAKHEAERTGPLAGLPETYDGGKVKGPTGPKDPGPKTYSQKKKPPKKR